MGRLLIIFPGLGDRPDIGRLGRCQDRHAGLILARWVCGRGEANVTRDREGKQLMIAFFGNPAAGDLAARMLARQARTCPAGGTVGVLAFDACGKIAAARLGPRAAAGGPAAGTVPGAIALAVTGRVMPGRAQLFDGKSDLSTDDLARFAAELEAGRPRWPSWAVGQQPSVPSSNSPGRAARPRCLAHRPGPSPGRPLPRGLPGSHRDFRLFLRRDFRPL
jgi:hypothetical protein